MTALPGDMSTEESAVPASRVICVRYPNGDSEWSSTSEIPDVGDTLRRGGHAWQVVHVEKDAFENPVLTLGEADGQETTLLGGPDAATA